MIRRKIFRNERQLYVRDCNLCKQKTISMYPQESLFNILCHKCWWSDKWNPLDFGRDYNWSKYFFLQFRELMFSVPRVALVQYHQNVNSEFNNFISDCKNTYLSNSAVSCENVAYSMAIDKTRDTLDSAFVKNSELCFENIDSSDNSNCIYLLKSRNCLDCAYLFDSVNCTNCFMSSNLRNKQFVFRNLQLTKGEYFKKIAEIQFGSHEISQKLKKEYSDMAISSLHKFANLIKTTNCVGDNISNSRNIYRSFNVYNAENIRYSTRSYDTKDSYDQRAGVNGELLYEVMTPGYSSSRALFCTYGEQTSNSNLSDWCHNSQSLFACIGLRNKSYCILNKQYTKEEYEALLPRIIKHMNDMPYIDKKGRVYRYGEFFPPELSPFSYNETIAQEYFPLTKEEAIKQGYSWKDPEPRNYQITLKNKDIPDHIKDVPDSILNEIIECAHNVESNVESSTFNNTLGCPTTKCNEQCTQAFRIIPSELDFLRKQNLPLPRLCPNCRHYQRIKQRNPLKLWHRNCNCRGKYGIAESGFKNQPASSADGESSIKYQNTITHEHKDSPCPNEFETSYAPERPEIVYCEQCYVKEVV